MERALLVFLVGGTLFLPFVVRIGPQGGRLVEDSHGGGSLLDLVEDKFVAVGVSSVGRCNGSH